MCLLLIFDDQFNHTNEQKLLYINNCAWLCLIAEECWTSSVQMWFTRPSAWGLFITLFGVKGFYICYKYNFCWTRNCPACSKIEGGFKSQSIGVYSTRNHQSTDLGCLRQSVLQRTNPRYIPTASFIVGVHMPPSSLREGGPPLDPPIRYHFFVSFFCKTDNPTQAKRPLSPPPRLLTPTLQKAHF